MRYGFHIVLALILASLPAVASADIVAWKDSAGVTHYTNLKSEVPAEQMAEVVVDEQVWLPKDSAVPDAKADPVAQPDPPGDSEDEVSRAYIAGLDSGLARNVSTGGSVYISGPLAVTISPSTPYGSYVVPGNDWLVPGYGYPFLTTVVGWHPGPIRAGFGGRRPFFRGFTNAAGPPPLGAAGGLAGRRSGSRFRW